MELSGDGVTVPVRVIEYFVEVEGQEVPETFCLVTDLMDYQDYPGPELAALYKWRWDGSETALREAKASSARRRAGHRADAPPRPPGPHPAQELAAWAAGVAMTRGVVLDAALGAVPARKGRRAASLSGPATRPTPAPSARSCPRSASDTPATRP